MDLTAIVVTKNEEANIGPCLEACMRSLDDALCKGSISTAEIFVVDSASVDHTVQIVEKYPVSIIRLSSLAPLSASAGRHVGLKHARGRRILYVDGDFELSPPWLAEAIQCLDSDSKLAAVSGRIEERYEDSTILAKRLMEAVGKHRAEPEAIPIGLYRRDALDATGGFHPFLRGGEDRELARRLRQAGYSLKGLDIPMGLHRRVPRGLKLDYVSFLKSAFWWSFGDGQAFRLGHRDQGSVGLGKPLRYLNLEHLRNYGLFFLVATVVLTNVACATRNLWFVALGVDAMAIVMARYLSHRAGLTWRETIFVFQGIPYSTVRHVAFLLGAMRKPRDATEYPRTEQVTKEPGLPISLALKQQRN